MREEYIQGKTTLKEVFAVLDACEAANLKHLERIAKLEELCHEMWWDFEGYDCKDVPEIQFYRERMEQLGLIEGSE